MPELQGQTGELRFTIEVKRAETGAIETYEMVGKIIAADEQEESE
jgi:hypothetical protein